MSASVSILMRAKNSDWVIDQALASLFSQDFGDFELLVVDSGSTDKTLDMVRKYLHRLLEIEPGDYYPGSVLNRGIEASDAEIIVFQNSDVAMLTPDCLGRLVAAFDDPEVQAAFARQLPRPEADTWVRRDYEASFPEKGPAPEWMTLSLPLAAMRRSAWERHKFYTDSWGSEDTEWGKWARDEGLKVAYVPDALVMHSHNYTLQQIYGRKFIEGEADAFIYGGKPSLARMVRGTITGTIKDWIAAISVSDLGDLWRAPARRAVYQWAYYKGFKLGAHRRDTGNTDTSIGQQTVLTRHESVRTPSGTGIGSSRS